VALAASGANIEMYDKSQLRVRADNALDGAKVNFVNGGTIALNGHSAAFSLIGRTYPFPVEENWRGFWMGDLNQAGVITTNGARDVVVAVDVKNTGFVAFRRGGSGWLRVRLRGDLIVTEAVRPGVEIDVLPSSRVRLVSDGASGIYTSPGSVLNAYGTVGELVLKGSLNTGGKSMHVDSLEIDGSTFIHSSASPISDGSTFQVLTANTPVRWGF
jgi:hypothetical protein